MYNRVRDSYFKHQMARKSEKKLATREIDLKIWDTLRISRSALPQDFLSLLVVSEHGIKAFRRNVLMLLNFSLLNMSRYLVTQLIEDKALTTVLCDSRPNA